MMKKFMLASFLVTIAACNAHAGEAIPGTGGGDASRLGLILGSFDRAGLAVEPDEDAVTVPTATTASDYDALIRDSFARAGMMVGLRADDCDRKRYDASGPCDEGAKLRPSD